MWLLAVCCLYGVTAALKLFEIVTNGRLDRYPDPVLPVLTFRETAVIAVLMEAATVAFCCARAAESKKWASVLVLSSLFAAYKAAFVLSGVGLPCACLGGVPAALGWSPLTTDIVTSGLLVAGWSAAAYFLRR